MLDWKEVIIVAITALLAAFAIEKCHSCQTLAIDKCTTIQCVKNHCIVNHSECSDPEE